MRVTIASISRKYEDACVVHAEEFLFSEPGKPRPCLMMLDLVYEGKRCRFALPLRSNIPANSPRHHYHSLPPTSRTKDKRHAGIHYAKMYPVPASEQQTYHMRSEQDRNTLVAIKNDYDDIKAEAQAFLDGHAEARKAFPNVVTDIDSIFSKVLPNF